jgi:hypothetical protein
MEKQQVYIKNLLVEYTDVADLCNKIREVDKCYNKFSDVWVLPYYFNELNDLLYEGLTKTTNIDKSIEIIKNIYNLKSFDIKRINNTNSFNIYVWEGANLQKIIKSINRGLLDTINNLGWFISAIRCVDEIGNRKLIDIKKIMNRNDILSVLNDNYYLCEIKLEAKFDIDIKIDQKIYHVSPFYLRDKILKQGLVPKNQNKKLFHPERIYCFKSLDIFNIKSFISKIFKTYKSDIMLKYHNDATIKYDLYEIDVNNLPILFYQDTNYLNFGIYTLNNIPPKYLNLIKTFTVDNVGKINEI